MGKYTYGFQACCSFPHGMISVYALILGLSSCLLSLSSSWGCNLVQVDYVFQNNSPEEIEVEGTSMTIGLLSYQETNPNSNLHCLSYSEAQIEEFDSTFRAARGCALIANILLGVGVLLLICMSCIAVKKSVVTILSGIFLLGGLFQGMILLIYFSSFSCQDCRFHFGSGLALLGTSVSMVCGAMVCHMPDATIYYESDDDDQENYSNVKHIGRPPTPRYITHGTVGVSASTSSSDGDEDEEEGEYDQEEVVIPKVWTVHEKEVVLVLPDGSKQVIETLEGPNKETGMCGAMCNFLPQDSGR